MPCRILTLLILFVVGLAKSAGTERPAEGIQDNSFLVEEAYNQEPGIVQHIVNVPLAFMDGNTRVFPSFTQEWPVFTQRHQFSYTIPYSFTEDQDRFEDIRLNYRCQVLMEGKQNPAFAPHFTLIIPTNDRDKQFRLDGIGYEVNLPFSKIVSDRLTLHFNAGSSFFPNGRDPNLWNYNLGASVIYAISANFNLMIETVAVWEEEVDRLRRVDRTLTALFSPAARYAFNFRNNAQLVLGLGVPVG